MATYTRGDIKNRLNAGIRGKVGILVDVDETVNMGVRDVTAEIDLRSMRRTVDMIPGVSGIIYEYPAPTDLKGVGIIGIRDLRDEYTQIPVELVTPTEFRQYRKANTIAVEDGNNVRSILAAVGSGQVAMLVSKLDTIVDGVGSWTLFGDAINVALNTADFVRGEGSISFDISAVGGTTAGIENVGLTPFDYSGYEDQRASVYVWTEITDKDQITNFTLRYGDSALVYNQIVVTQTAFGTAFTTGWNLLRFDVSTKTVVGAPLTSAGTYVALFMTKNALKISQTGFKFDTIMFVQGVSKKVTYYGKSPWRDATTGAYKEEASIDADILIADNDEYDLFLQKIVEIAADEVDEAQVSVNAATRYAQKKKQYQSNNPSEALLLTYDYQAQYYI